MPGVEGRSDGVCTVRCLYCSVWGLKGGDIDWSPGHVRRRPPGPGGSCAAWRAGHCSGRGDSGQAVGAPSPVSENIWLSGPRPDLIQFQLTWSYFDDSKKDKKPKRKEGVKVRLLR